MGYSRLYPLILGTPPAQDKVKEAMPKLNNELNKVIEHLNDLDTRKSETTHNHEETYYKKTDAVTKLGNNALSADGFKVWMDKKDMPYSLLTNGYFELPNGLIVKWGYKAHPQPTEEVSIPIQLDFPNNCFNAQVTVVNSTANGAQDTWAQIVSISKTTLTIIMGYDGDDTKFAEGFYWIAIGN